MTYVTMGSCCNSLPCHNSCDRMQAGQISRPLHEGQALFNVIRSPWMSHEREINCIRFQFLCYHRMIYCSLHQPLVLFFFLNLLFGSRWQGERSPCPYPRNIPALLQKSGQLQWCITIFHPGHLWQLHIGFSPLVDQLGRLQVHDTVYVGGL